MGAAKPLDKEINDYLKDLNPRQKKVVLSVVKELARQEADWWAEVEDAAKESIERGLKETREGKITPHEEVVKKYSQWL